MEQQQGNMHINNVKMCKTWLPADGEHPDDDGKHAQHTHSPVWLSSGS